MSRNDSDYSANDIEEMAELNRLRRQTEELRKHIEWGILYSMNPRWIEAANELLTRHVKEEE